MSTASDVARVFTDTEEETYSLFSTLQQTMLSKGQLDRAIVSKLLRMKFHEFQWESMFLFFESFLRTLRGWCTPDTIRQFRLIKKFATEKSHDYMEEDGILTQKPDDFVEVTASGHTFKGNDLIAF